MDVLSLTKSKTYITIIDTVFKGNTAYKGAGCIWMGVKTVFTLKNNQFIKNKASIGGAIFSEAGIAKITKCVFKSNKAGKVTSWTVKTNRWCFKTLWRSYNDPKQKHQNLQMYLQQE